jgi:hypothetical protein
MIKQLFEKQIDRDIRSVIKPGQDEENITSEELEEYVVTKEINRQFDLFFSNYCKSIQNPTDKMGVWISGFFGSGKSHLLKILAYILDNKTVKNMTAADYFASSKKITDNMILGNMKLASQQPTDVILFDIDSKAKVSSQSKKDSILNIFLRVFNEKLGFYGSNPWVADLEKDLSEQGKFDIFKNKIKEKTNKHWEDIRNQFRFRQDIIVEALTDLDIMSEESARNFCNSAMTDYKITPEEFAEMVKKYIDSKGKNHRVVFLADEVGQYIGSDSTLMLDMQTVTVDLGRICKGRVWVIVTSQQDVDKTTKVIGGDFSKIQDRFDTRLSLSPAYVDEIVRKRILSKNQAAKDMLQMLYDEKQSIIKNIIVFNSKAEIKLYDDRASFASDYPFIPYHFNLLGRVLNAIREHSAIGKNVSDGERSMLAMFQEATISIMDKDVGLLTPFSCFYLPLEKFVDGSYQAVITNAQRNSNLYDYDVEVLKVLFMVKYVKEFIADLNNITTLMIDNIDIDRVELTQKIEESLQRLINENLVQKALVQQNEIYIFLTNEEQEISREINNTFIEQSETLFQIADFIFGDLYSENKYRYSARYNFDFNKIVDDRYYKNVQTNDIGVKVITPYHTGAIDSSALRLMSSQEKNVIILLPEDSPYFDETESFLKIDKFISKNSSSSAVNMKTIRESKQIERQERRNRAKMFVAEAIRHAEVFVNGDTLDSKAKDVETRINEALKKLIDSVYNCLSYMDTPVSDADISKVLNEREESIMDLSNAQEDNHLAIKEVFNYIELCTSRRLKASIKSIKERYIKAPFGFNDKDVEWIIAKLFKKGEINLILNSEIISINNKTIEEITRYITRREYVDRILIEKRERVNDGQLKAAKRILTTYFNEFSSMSDNEDNIMRIFKKNSDRLLEDLRGYEKRYISEKALPGETVIEEGIRIFNTLHKIEEIVQFFRMVYNKSEDIENFFDEYTRIKEFFNGEQYKHFERALRIIKIYDQSQVYIVDEELTKQAKEIKAIIESRNPYSDIHKLPVMYENFRALYGKHLDKLMEPTLKEIDISKQRVLDELKDEKIKDIFLSKANKTFEALKDRAERSNNVAELKNLSLEISTSKDRLINDITEQTMRLRMAAKAAQNSEQDIQQETPKPIRIRKTVSLRNVVQGTSWFINDEKDVDKCLQEIKTGIMQELKESKEIRLEV